MKFFIISSMICFSIVASAQSQFRRNPRQQFGRHQQPQQPQQPQFPQPNRPTAVVDVKGQGFYPDTTTANALCASRGHQEMSTFYAWQQAGGALQGTRSYDGITFNSYKWYTGSAIDKVLCYVQVQPLTVDVKGQGYFPDHTTALALCRSRGKAQVQTFIPWQQAGGALAGVRSYDGVTFNSDKWYTGTAIDKVICL